MPLTLAQYKNKYLSDLRRQDTHYQTIKNLADVINNAARAIDSNGKMNSHQHRIGRKKCALGALELSKYEDQIKKAKSFEEIFQITETVKNRVFGLGDLWSYDTALRIGFAKGIYPKEVYVQSGVKDGLRKLFKDKLPKGRSLPLSVFPKDIRMLKPYQIENFLCIYGRKKK